MDRVQFMPAQQEPPEVPSLMHSAPTVAQLPATGGGGEAGDGPEYAPPPIEV
jgi:hypothetical protein